MNELQDTKYMRWLEKTVGTIIETPTESMIMVAKREDGAVMTAYYNADAEDKAIFAHHIQSDVTMDIIEANIDRIRDLLSEGDGGTP